MMRQAKRTQQFCTYHQGGHPIGDECAEWHHAVEARDGERGYHARERERWKQVPNQGTRCLICTRLMVKVPKRGRPPVTCSETCAAIRERVTQRRRRAGNPVTKPKSGNRAVLREPRDNPELAAFFEAFPAGTYGVYDHKKWSSDDE
jgi:hypothetical protein